jgi:N-acetylmuramic acid 6-phosphate etherase
MNADEFLTIAGDFQLGALDTESPHPLTGDLARLAREDLAEGIRILREVDLLALRRFADAAGQLPAMAEAIATCLGAGNRVFLCGCGATGRLSLSLELFCREGLLPKASAARVLAFMAGGDLALIRAVEKFEDHPEYGARQLEDLGFRDGDLLLASTEGGETPWVIGATERAAAISSQAPFFLYCNPDEILAATAERSRRVLANPAIRKVNLAVGPMALSGSTRMQATTVLTAALVFAFASRANPAAAAALPDRLRSLLEATDWSFLAPFTEREASLCSRGEYTLYEPGPFGITVLTDTTERSPTFSLQPFENQNDPKARASWCHLFMPSAQDGPSAWRQLLHREPRAVDWPEVASTTGLRVIHGYDFSARLPELRRRRTHGALHHVFRIEGGPGRILLHYGPLHHTIRWQATGGSDGMAEAHLMLKMLLNAHSTLLMGRLGRYEDNVMTWVRPANNKLIDRAIRYVRLLAARRGLAPGYEETCRALFRVIDSLKPDQSVVLRTLEALAGPA